MTTDSLCNPGQSIWRRRQFKRGMTLFTALRILIARFVDGIVSAVARRSMLPERLRELGVLHGGSIFGLSDARC